MRLSLWRDALLLRLIESCGLGSDETEEAGVLDEGSRHFHHKLFSRGHESAYLDPVSEIRRGLHKIGLARLGVYGEPELCFLDRGFAQHRRRRQRDRGRRVIKQERLALDMFRLRRVIG